MKRITYLIPRSICSWIPNPKQPVSLKLRLRSSYSFTFKPLSRSCICFVSSNSHIACNLFITPDAEWPHSVPCCIKQYNYNYNSHHYYYLHTTPFFFSHNYSYKSHHHYFQKCLKNTTLKVHVQTICSTTYSTTRFQIFHLRVRHPHLNRATPTLVHLVLLHTYLL